MSARARGLAATCVLVVLRQVGAGRFFLHHFFYVSVPLAAVGALAQPFGALRATALAEKAGFYFSHLLVLGNE